MNNSDEHAVSAFSDPTREEVLASRAHDESASEEPRDAVEAWRRDPANARKLIDELVPDEKARRVFLNFFAETIVQCHQHGASRWSVTLRHSRRIHVNLGRLLVWGIDRDGIWIGLHPDSLDENDRAQLDRDAKKLDPFSSAPEILIYRVPIVTFVDIHARIEPAYLRFLERAAGTAKQPPYFNAHSPGVIQYLRDACKRALPDPQYVFAEPKPSGVIGTDRVFWVNQGRSFGKERQEGYIFAGKVDAGGRQPGHWKLLSNLREGDLLVHYVSGEIRAIGRVEGPATDATLEYEGERREGRRVDIEYFDLANSIPLADVVEGIAALEIANGPLGANSKPNQGYLWRFSAEGLDVLREARDQEWPAWATPTHTQRSWIFQGNPEKYDLRNAVKKLPALYWMVKQYSKEVRPGDSVYLWESGRDGGVLARGTVLTKPERIPFDPAEAPFVRDDSLSIDDDTLRVRIRIDKLVQPPVGRARFKAHPALANCAIVRTPQGTNFRLSPEQGLALATMIEDAMPVQNAAPRPVEETPSIAAFDALMASIERAKLYYSEELVSHYLLALQTKRFVILTGISGTGKTQLALEVAKHFQATVTSQQPAEMPDDAVRMRVSPYMLEQRRLMVPAVLAAQLFPGRAEGSDRRTVRVAYGDGREIALACHRDPARSRNMLMLFLRSEFAVWFEEHFDVGDEFYLRLNGEEGKGNHCLEIIASEKKTRTETIENRAVVAVRPDWTDSRGLLGYYNAITRRYSTTPFLRLLLRAADEQERAEREGRQAQPFFVILDEMNLARVEHYFSDFLSALESGEKLILHDEPAIETGALDAADDDESPLVPRSLFVPSNLFFTGTVNIDETTHMFSPKVLDRAFVIELNEVDLLGYGTRARAQTALRLPGFDSLSKHNKPSTKDWDVLGDEEDGALRNAVVELHDILTQDNRHFGFRVANEIARFVLLASQQAPGHTGVLWTALDLAVLSKVLPKLHGTQQDLEDLAGRLHAFTITGSKDAATPALMHWIPRGGILTAIDKETNATIRLPRSAAKLWRMRRRLERQGFTSFIE